MKETVLESLAKFQRQGSNWRFHSVFESGSSHRKVRATLRLLYIPLPAFLAAKKAIINFRNEEDKC